MVAEPRPAGSQSRTPRAGSRSAARRCTGRHVGPCATATWYRGAWTAPAHRSARRRAAPSPQASNPQAWMYSGNSRVQLPVVGSGRHGSSHQFVIRAGFRANPLPVALRACASFLPAGRPERRTGAERETEQDDASEQHQRRRHSRIAADDTPDRRDERHHREEAQDADQHLEVLSLPHVDRPGQLFTPPAVRPDTIRRWNSSTMITSGTVTRVPAAMIAAYGTTCGSLPENRAIATVTGSVASLES